jgi:transcriptional regulator NrdR family protein
MMIDLRRESSLQLLAEVSRAVFETLKTCDPIDYDTRNAAVRRRFPDISDKMLVLRRHSGLGGS